MWIPASDVLMEFWVDINTSLIIINPYSNFALQEEDHSIP
ncbi:hypothetical protein OIU74_016145 [Salix koriyanagi]|uniref:Uncharacterized protein n=1 Tax=Salix koriyanagi TaxID=2511006 RepID=A0A9Q0PFQ6_9ROSI|nr:hypothetical protein OIU74_016145 [Salix koriyanagi]